jgi:exodeoxyribonuclease V alpha subunit
MSSLQDILAAKKAAQQPPKIEPPKIESIASSAPLKLSLAEKLRLAKEAKEAKEATALVAEPSEDRLPPEIASEPTPEAHYEGAFSLSIQLNEKQLLAKEYAFADKSFCLIGAAGTGKTTAQRAVAESLLEQGKLQTAVFKVQGQRERVTAPSIAFVAYTRRATANLQRAIHKNPRLEEALRFNVMTIHNLLEYEPETYWDDVEEKEKFRFVPKRDSKNPLTITHLVIEEASMLGLDLWDKLYDALMPGVQIIFIGDINQLPPVFGSSILNYALVQLPVIELTHVYRQEADSLVLENAHRILAGQDLIEDPAKGFSIIRGKSKIQVGQHKMAQALGSMFKAWEANGSYDPEQDIILSPFNKQDLGTDNMNKWIAQFLGEKRNAVVHEIQAGFTKLYLAVGDKVMFNKQDGIISKISVNYQYHGTPPQIQGTDLSRFGVRIIGKNGDNQDQDGEDVDLDSVILNYSNFSLDEDEDIERKQQASHVVDVTLETGEVVSLSSAGQFAPQVFSLGYVLTVHKAQGCEWRKVYIIAHKDHSVLLFRELFYTAVTRAREEVILFAKDPVISKAIKTQRIKGNSLEEKIEYFNSGIIDPLGMIRATK